MPYRRNNRSSASALRISEWRTRSATELKEMGVARESLCELENQLRGKVILRGAPSYDVARQHANPAFQKYPQLVAYCEVIEDVRLCLTFAHSHDLWVACRAGGHSFGGYSVNSGMVIDVSKMSYVHVLPGEHIARVGAGTNFGYLNAVLDEHGLHVPSGACEDVCVAGYMQGGGYGYTSRRFGMNCDNVIQFRMMLRDGKVVKEAQQAGYVARPLCHDDWKVIVEFCKTSPNSFYTVVIEPYGGAINDYSEFSNEVVHRNVDKDFFVDVFWILDDDKTEAVAWLDNFMQVMNPYFNGHVYQNYPRDTLANYRSMYFGAAYDALLNIKNKYDPPLCFFRYQRASSPTPMAKNRPQSAIRKYWRGSPTTTSSTMSERYL